MPNNNIDDNCLDWTDTIEDDGNNLVVLDEGDYNYTVTKLERGRFQGGTKIPACNEATLTLRVDTEDGVALIRTNLFLHQSVEWKLSSFFRSIGLKKCGEKLKMDWDKVVGRQGRAHFAPSTFHDKEGIERKTNSLIRFYDYEDDYFTQDVDSEEVPFK